MRHFLIILVCMCATMQSAQAQEQETELVSLQTLQDSQGWEAVGRLDIEGKGFCTAALIRESLILTAAHCLYDEDGTPIESDRFEFKAGLRDGRASATRSVRQAIPHPDYHPGVDSFEPQVVAVDIAVLELSRPIQNARIRPYSIATRPLTGDEIGVVSYGRGREDVASLQEVCHVLGRQTGVIVMTCDVDFGSSGAPVFTVRDGETRIASVISGMGRVDGEKISLGTSLDGPLSVLLAHFSSTGPALPGGTQRLISTGEGNDTGAKFISVN